MALELLGYSNDKQVLVTPYAKWRLGSRNLTYEEALEVLNKRDISYPKDEDGRQKIRTTIGKGKKAFLVVFEDDQKIIIITGGET